MKIAEIISDVFHSVMPLKQNFSLKFSHKPVQEGFKHVLKHIMNPSGKVCTFQTHNFNHDLNSDYIFSDI